MPDRPNILLILTDQHRLSGVGCYGETPCRTPNLDRLAAEGIRFETAYTPCPVCAPARASVITGRFPHNHGITANVGDLGCSVHELPDDASLLSRRLQSAGYWLGYSGKWHLGTNPYMPPAFAVGQRGHVSVPASVGFEGQQLFGHGNGGWYYPEYHHHLVKQGFPVDTRLRVHRAENPVFGCGLMDAPKEAAPAHWITDHTLSLLERFRTQEEPFFLWHNFWGPHSPAFVPEELYAMYRDASIPEWPSFRVAGMEDLPKMLHTHPEHPWTTWEEALRYYYAFVTFLDWEIGRIVEHLRASGQLESTWIVFAADHGETLGSHGGMKNKGFGHFEEILRVPLIVRPPERFAGGLIRGTTRSAFASLVDLHPTFLDWAGAEAPEVDGVSLNPVLWEGNEAGTDRAAVEFFGLAGTQSTMVTFRQGDWKYGYNAGGRDELYDLRRDPHETRNRIDDPDCAEALSSLRAGLEKWMERTGYKGRNTFRFTRQVVK